MSAVIVAESRRRKIGACSLRHPALVCGALGVGLGLGWGGRPSYWFDEAATLSAARRSVPQLWALLHSTDAVHGLYYLGMHGWLALFGTGETAARAPSAIGLGLACALVALLGTDLGVPRLGWSAGLLAVVLPGLAWSGSEARQYSWSAALAVLATWLLLRSQISGRTLDWVAYGVVLLLGAYVFVFSLLLVPAHLVTLLAQSRRPWRAWVTAVIAVAFASLPLVYAGATQLDTQLSWLSESPFHVITHALLVQYFLSAQTPTNWLTLSCAALLLALATVLTAAAMLLARHNQMLRGPLAVVLPWVVVPTVVLLVVSMLGHPVYQERYLTFCAPGVALLLGLGLMTLPHRPILPIVCVLVIVLAATPILIAQKAVNAKFDQNYRALADFLGSPDRDLSAVIVADVGARGILIAYPDRVGKIRELNPGATPTSRNSLWGTVRRPRDHVRSPRPGSNLALLTLTHRPRHLQTWRRWLRRRDCREGALLRERRYTARSFRCTNPTAHPRRHQASLPIGWQSSVGRPQLSGTSPLCQELRVGVLECAPALVAVKVVRPVGRSTLTAPSRRRVARGAEPARGFGDGLVGGSVDVAGPGSG